MCRCGGNFIFLFFKPSQGCLSLWDLAISGSDIKLDPCMIGYCSWSEPLAGLALRGNLLGLGRGQAVEVAKLTQTSTDPAEVDIVSYACKHCMQVPWPGMLVLPRHLLLRVPCLARPRLPSRSHMTVPSLYPPSLVRFVHLTYQPQK